MALLSLFGSARTAPAASGARDPAATARSEPVFAPRRSTGLVPMPPNTRLPSVLGAQPKTFARGREVAALLFWTFAVFLGLALASYAGDSQGTVTAEGQLVVAGENWVGPVGASLARALVLLIGVAAWVVPPLEVTLARSVAASSCAFSNK